MPKTLQASTRDSSGSTKAKILAAAEAVFAARGFDGASTREIAARASVNISSLHYHWESKELLYVAVFRDIYQRLDGALQAAMAPLLADRRPKDEVIDRATAEVFGFFKAHPTLPRLLLRWIIDEDSIELGIARDVLTPAWAGSVAWLATQSQPMAEIDAKLFVLTMHSVAMLYLLDSQSYQRFLGGSVHEHPLAQQVREHFGTLMRRLLPS